MKSILKIYSQRISDLYRQLDFDLFMPEFKRKRILTEIEKLNYERNNINKQTQEEESCFAKRI